MKPAAAIRFETGFSRESLRSAFGRNEGVDGRVTMDTHAPDLVFRATEEDD